MMGWMQPHRFPAGSRFVNDAIAKQVSCTRTGSWAPRSCRRKQRVRPESLRTGARAGAQGARVRGDVLEPGSSGQRTTPGMHEPYWYPDVRVMSEKQVCPSSSTVQIRSTRGIGIIPQNYQIGFVLSNSSLRKLLSTATYSNGNPGVEGDVCQLRRRARPVIKTRPSPGAERPEQ